MSLETQISEAACKAAREAIAKSLDSYNGPLQKMAGQVVEENREVLLAILRQSFTDTIATDEFRSAVREAFVHKLARFLVAKVEGSVEKAANQMLADPEAKARMVLAVKSVIVGGAEGGSR